MRLKVTRGQHAHREGGVLTVYREGEVIESGTEAMLRNMPDKFEAVEGNSEADDQASKWTKAELLEFAREMEIKGAGQMSKAELYDAVTEAEGGTDD